MEKFKAVEKEMKTKAFSKEGLNAPGKRDPKEQEKEEVGQFLSDMIGDLERQIEAMEAEEEQLQATVKKGKRDAMKADRLSEITKKYETHRFHIGKMELLRRSLENGNVEPEKVQEIKEDIEYYVNDNNSIDFMEEGTDDIYNDLNLEEDEGVYGLANEIDKVSSQDAQSTADEIPEVIDKPTAGPAGNKPKSSSISEPPPPTGTRRPSNAVKSPLPALATLHTPLPSTTVSVVKESMKPAPIPTRPPGETLKYASAAAAAAASDKVAVGIAPLPPPPTSSGPTSSSSVPTAASSSAPIPAPAVAPSAPPGLSAPPQPPKNIIASSPKVASSLLPNTAAPNPPMSTTDLEQIVGKAKAAAANQAANQKPSDGKANHVQASSEIMESSGNASITSKPLSTPPISASSEPPSTVSEKSPAPQPVNGEQYQPPEEESIYHLPPGLTDLIQSFEITKRNPPSPEVPAVQRLLLASQNSRPDYLDAEKPNHYRPDTKFSTPSYYPQDPFPYVDDPNLYAKVDTDTLFYIFYYRQNTYQQYMAAKALKSQSWRFHKQYQTWFQRHEEPKTITEEFEQGTYRFFDYESTWYALAQPHPKKLGLISPPSFAKNTFADQKSPLG